MLLIYPFMKIIIFQRIRYLNFIVYIKICLRDENKVKHLNNSKHYIYIYHLIKKILSILKPLSQKIVSYKHIPRITIFQFSRYRIPPPSSLRTEFVKLARNRTGPALQNAKLGTPRIWRINTVKGGGRRRGELVDVHRKTGMPGNSGIGWQQKGRAEGIRQTRTRIQEREHRDRERYIYGESVRRIEREREETTGFRFGVSRREAQDFTGGWSRMDASPAALPLTARNWNCIGVAR